MNSLLRINAIKAKFDTISSPSLSVSRQIAGATTIVAVTTALVAFISIPRELLIAARFGTGDVADAYLVALVAPTFVLGVLGGSVASAFIPAYMHVIERDGQPAGDRLMRDLTTTLIGLLSLVSLVVALISPYVLRVLASNFASPKLLLTQEAMLVLLLTVPLGGISALWTAALNSRNWFALPSLSQGVIPVLGIGALLIFPNSGIDALTWGMVAGFALRAVILGWALCGLGIAIAPGWSRPSDNMRRVGQQFAPMAAASLLMGGTTIVDQSVAASLGSGSVATLAYGLKFISLATSLGSVALGTAVLPFLSRMVATNNWTQLRSTVKTFTLLALFATLPVAVSVSVFSVPLVSLLYERGVFTPGDTAAVAQVLALGVWQLPFLAVGIVFSRLISSLGSNHLLLVQAALVLGLDIVLDVVLSRKFGVSGIALATTLVYVASLIFLAVAARFALRQAE